MAARQRKALVVTNLKGRDGSTDADIAIPNHRAKEVRNCDFFRTPFARKRNGSHAVFGDTSGEAFTGVISFLGRHVPGADETAAELWAVDSAATPVVQRLAGGTAWASPTLKDNIATRPQDVWGVSFNGKYFLFYDSSQDRLHAWDGTTVRRVGLATPAAPTAADTGSGTYAATLRYYRVRYERRDGSTTIARSEASPPVSFTPSGSGTHARITKPASISEGETHWRIEISEDDSVWYILTSLAVGTTTYDDNTDMTALGGTLSEEAGQFTVPVSAKFGVVDGNRLLIAGPWETTTYNSRVWYTPRLGTDEGDDERIPDTVTQENWIDLDEKDGGAITALGGPIQGMPVVFKYRQVWKLRPTQEFDAPYAPMAISKAVGCIRQHSVVMAKDENGDPALYWLSYDGPYRLGTRGLQYLGMDVRDLWRRVNLEASTVTCFGVYHPDRHQIWWWLSVDDNNSPGIIMVFDVEHGEPDEDNNVRDGWSTFDGAPAEARCATMFSNTLGASMSRDLRPYIGYDTGSVLLKADTGSVDNGEQYAAYVQIPQKHLAGLDTHCEVDQVIVLGSVGSHTFQFDMDRDYGCEVRSSHVSMEAKELNQTRAQRAFENAFQADAMSVGMRVGDICPTGALWEIDAIVIQHEAKQGVAP